MSEKITMSTTKTPYVLVKRPGEAFHVALFPDHQSGKQLEWLQKICDGYIETVPFLKLEQRLLLICNEEGKLREMEANFVYNGDLIVGPVVVVSFNSEGEMLSLTRSQIDYIRDTLRLSEFNTMPEEN